MKIKPWQLILAAMALALGVGSFVNSQMKTGSEFTPMGKSLVSAFDYIGNIFMSLLKMVIVPLVFSSVVVGIARLGNTKGFARMGFKTIGYYALTSLIAILIGLSMVNFSNPASMPTANPMKKSALK